MRLIIVEEIAKHARFEPLDHAAMDGIRLCKVSRARGARLRLPCGTPWNRRWGVSEPRMLTLATRLAERNWQN